MGELNRQGWDTGEEPIWRGLDRRLPRARVRRVLRELKRERRQRTSQQSKARRVSMRVLASDVVWSMDATHLGRSAWGASVQGEVIREVASTRTIGLSVGLQATGAQVVQLLEVTALERGGAPLVLLTDNGGGYVSEEVAAWCKRNGVLHVRSLPHTPQHNGASEHGMRGLKLNSGLDIGGAVVGIGDARAKLQSARNRIDNNRLRRTRGWRTAVECDCAMRHWSTLVDREEVLQKAACAIARGLLNCKGKRARRRATREAILGTLQHFSLIQRTRGGRPWTAHKAESET